MLKTKLLMISEYLYNADNSSIDYLEEAYANMSSISSFSPDYHSLKERLQVTIIELKDIFRETELALKTIDYDQSNIVKLKERLDLINNLCKKHNLRDETALIELQSDLKNKVEAVLNLDDDIEKAKLQEKASMEKMLATAKKLTECRLKVLPDIEIKITRLLAELGIPNGTLVIEHQQDIPTPTGIDKINLLFSANKGIAPQTLKNVASGGEFSRLMLAIKYILANKRALPTIIFDEIDTGVSGEISIKVGKIMREMANLHQIIAITHLHQIAAQGNSHYYVYKDDSSSKTASKIKQLTKQERVIEIAQMIGGAAPSAGILENAKAILEGYEL
jgi:DNA repair protein RecN (Recombination protein N)